MGFEIVGTEIFHSVSVSWSVTLPIFGSLEKIEGFLSLGTENTQLTKQIILHSRLLKRENKLVIAVFISIYTV